MPHDVDVEKGLLSGKQAFPHILDAHSQESQPKQHPQRRQRYVGLGLLVVCACLLLVGLETRSLSARGGTPAWALAPQAGRVETSSPGHPAIATLQHLVDTAADQPPPSEQSPGSKVYEPTAALRKLAAQLHQSLPSPSSLWRPKPKKSGPSHADQMLLLIAAAGNKAYTFPIDAKQRAAELMPDTVESFAHMLRRVMPSPDSDARMYADEHGSWQRMHRQASPLTVFTKSYCPYSRRATNRLRSFGARFDEFVVDLRDDASGLQSALREVSGHRTFPAIFMGDELLGGSDDLARLHKTHALRGILQAGHVQFDEGRT